MQSVGKFIFCGITLIFLIGMYNCDFLVSPEVTSKNNGLSGEQDSITVIYPIHRGYHQKVHLNGSGSGLYYIGINFETELHSRQQNVPVVQEYDMLLTLDYSNKRRILVSGGENINTTIYIYGKVDDFTDMNALPVDSARISTKMIDEDQSIFLLVRNRMGRYAKFYLSSQDWICNNNAGQCEVRFYFEYYYYLDPEPDLNLH